MLSRPFILLLYFSKALLALCVFCHMQLFYFTVYYVAEMTLNLPDLLTALIIQANV